MELDKPYIAVKTIVAAGFFSKTKIYDAVANGDLEAIRLGRGIRISAQAWQRFITEHQSGSNEKIAA